MKHEIESYSDMILNKQACKESRMERESPEPLYDIFECHSNTMIGWKPVTYREAPVIIWDSLFLGP